MLVFEQNGITSNVKQAENHKANNTAMDKQCRHSADDVLKAGS